MCLLRRNAYKEVFSEAFHDRDLMAFVQKVRNCYGHEMLLHVTPKGTISLGNKIEVESALVFDKERLLILKDAWNKEAKHFIESNDELNVLEIVNRYYQMALSLYHSYGSATGASHSDGYREIKRCKQGVFAASKIMALGILLQGAKQRGIDPYAHLAMHFTADEIDRIQCFHSYTPEQVDFMIELRDPLGFCDNSLREELYKVFGCCSV